MNPQIILASSSPYRAQLLKQLSLSFEAMSPTVDEEKVKNSSLLKPKDLSLHLSLLKGQDILSKTGHENIIISSDQICVSCDENIYFNKPYNKENAINQLIKLQNRHHYLYTSFHLFYKGNILSHTDTTTLYMRPLSLEQIKSYVDKDNPLDCAGSYRLESLGISLFEKIETNDSTSIIGLPLITLTNFLVNQIGINLWNHH